MAVKLPAQCTRVYTRLFGASRALASSSYASRRQKHTLPGLPYDYGALEPHILGEIMELHHSKHHQTYVNNLIVAEEKMAEAAATGAHTHTHAPGLGHRQSCHTGTTNPFRMCTQHNTFTCVHNTYTQGKQFVSTEVAHKWCLISSVLSCLLLCQCTCRRHQHSYPAWSGSPIQWRGPYQSLHLLDKPLPQWRWRARW